MLQLQKSRQLSGGGEIRGEALGAGIVAGGWGGGEEDSLPGGRLLASACASCPVSPSLFPGEREKRGEWGPDPMDVGWMGTLLSCCTHF